VADGEHTAMERVKAARGEAMIDRVIAQTHGTELPPGNDAVLARSQPGDRDVRGGFTAYIAV